MDNLMKKGDFTLMKVAQILLAIIVLVFLIYLFVPLAKLRDIFLAFFP